MLAAEFLVVLPVLATSDQQKPGAGMGSAGEPQQQQQLPPFHLAFPVHCIDAAREFYGRWVLLLQ